MSQMERLLVSAFVFIDSVRASSLAQADEFDCTKTNDCVHCWHIQDATEAQELLDRLESSISIREFMSKGEY